MKWGFIAGMLLVAVQVQALPVAVVLSDFSGFDAEEMIVNQRVDIDSDGLLDTVQVRLAHDGAGSWPVELLPGCPLKVRVQSVGYTLASGESGIGRFLAYSAVELNRATELVINRRLKAEPKQFSALEHKGRTLTLKAPDSAAAPIVVNAMKFEVAVGPQRPVSGVFWMILRGLSPLLLLSLRWCFPSLSARQALPA